jgi:hypothetical protein
MKKAIGLVKESPEFSFAIAFSIALAVVVIHNTIVFGAFNPL